MRNNYLCLIATFLIVLIVSLPIYSSLAFASLDNGGVRGINEIEGYVREEDTVTISVDASIEVDNEISPLQIHLIDSHGPTFHNCNNIGGGTFNCNYQTNSGSIEENPFKFRLALYNDKNFFDSMVLINGVKDVIGPKIISFNVNPPIAGKGNVDFNYIIEDYAYDGGSGKCVGIKDLIVRYGTNSKVVPIDSEPGNCIYEGSFSEKLETITLLTSGNITVEAKAYDNFMQESSIVTAILTVDKIAPIIDFDTFKIFDKNNIEIKGVSGSLTASASISVSDSDVASVKADLSSLKASNGAMIANCNNGNCVWSNVGIDISSSGDRDIIINATDNVGNSRIEKKIYHFDFDNKQPVVMSVKTNYVDSDGNSYLGKSNNTIIVEIDEAGIGFNNKNVYLDLRNINNNQNAQADGCSKEDNVWRCYWNNLRVDVSDGSKQISIKPNSADDLGNLVSGTLIYNIIVDRTNPVIGEISYTPQAPVSGDTLTFTFNVEDKSPITPTINSSLISTTTIHQGTCTNNECSINVGDLVSSYTKANVKIIGEDPVGDIDIKEKEVIIYQSNENATPNFFNVRDIEVIPARIDKKVASQISMNIFVHVLLSSTGSGKIISMTPNCAEMANYLAASPYIMNEDSNDPYIAIQTNVGAGYAGDTLPIKCKLRLNVKDERNIYTKYEEENIDTNLELYGNTLGNIGDAVKEKLEGINAEIESVDKDIEKYQKWIDTWGLWCQISEGLGMVNSVLQGIKSVIYIILSAVWFACTALSVGAPACMKAVDAAWFGSTCVTLSEYHSRTIEMLIWPSGYISPFLIGLINKWSCMIAFHCAMCNINEIFNIGASIYTSRAAEQMSTRPKTTDSKGTMVLEGDTVEFEDSARVTQKGKVFFINDDSGEVYVRTEDNENFKRQPSDVTSTEWNRPKVLQITGRPGEKGTTIGSDTEGPPPEGEKIWYEGTRSGTSTTPSTESPTTSIKSNPDYQRDFNNEPIEGKSIIRHKSSGTQYTYAGEDSKGKEIWSRSYLGWEEQGKVTSATASDGWLFNPYKSIHYAKSCLCLPAIVYNLKKEKQITCMQRNCITHHVTNGISTSDCDVAYKERYCLYIEGAEFKKHGFSNMLGNFWEWAKDNAAFLAASLGYLAACMKYIVTPEAVCAEAIALGTPAGGAHPSLCGVWGGAMTMMELINVFSSKFSFLNYEQDLEGEDYCASQNFEQTS